MLPLDFRIGRRRTFRVLCLGAHSDDIEIGCGGTILRLLKERTPIDVTWAVLSAEGPRAAEADASARALLRRASSSKVVLGDLPDSHFPAQFARAKALIGDLARKTQPDLIFTHRLDDRHQDHRLVGELTWQTWRDHLIMEYEIPKYEGDLGQPNVFVPLTKENARRKVAHLFKYFSSQRSKTWFDPDTFRGLMRLRGIECRAASGSAEAFHVRKAVF